MTTQEDISLLSSLRSELDKIKSEISSMRVFGDQAVSLPGQFEGRAIPSRIGAEVHFDGTTRKHQINIIVPPDGPFFATSIFIAFRFGSYYLSRLQATYTYSWIPISSIEDLTLSFPALDFYWEYQVTGSDRRRQNIPVPSAMIRRTETGMGQMPLVPHDVFQAASTVIVYITPTINANTVYSLDDHLDNRLWVGFNGFYSLDAK